MKKSNKNYKKKHAAGKNEKHTPQGRQKKTGTEKNRQTTAVTRKKNVKQRPKQSIASQKNAGFKRKYIWWIAAILLITLISYFPAFKNKLTNFDDNLYITENPHITSPTESLFTMYYMGNFHPFSMFTLAIDHHLGKTKAIKKLGNSLRGEEVQYKSYEADPLMYHVTNILLHLLNTAMLFWFVYILINYISRTKPNKRNWSLEIAIIVATLFGVHTIHIESVAWVSERKDVLYTFFFLTALIAYIKYIDFKKTKFLIYTILLFICSLLSKGQAVSLAVTLVALDFMCNRPLLKRKVIIEKIPFFILALIFGILAIKAQQSSKSIATEDHWSFFERIIFACYGYMQYLFKLLFPSNLSVFHPYPDRLPSGGLPKEFYIYPVLVLMVITGFIFSVKRNKKIAFGILFFTINVFLVLQLLPVGKAIMADRYTYVASIGFYFIIAAGYQFIASKIKKAVIPLQILLTVYTVAIAYMTFERTKLWKDSLLLWNDVIKQYPNSDLAYNNRGDILSNRKRYDEALADFNRAIELNPNYDQTYYNRGVVKARLKNRHEALKDFNKALELKPEYPEAFCNRGATRFELGNQKKALEDFNRAIELKPNYLIAYSNRGSAKAMLGDHEGAIADFTKAISLQPDNGKIYYMRGLTRINSNKKQAGCADLQTAVKLGFTQAQAELQKRCK